MARKQVEIIELDAQRVEELLRRAEEHAFDVEDYQTIRLLVESYVHLTSMLGDKHTTITRLRKLLFGASSEKTEKVVGDKTDSATPSVTDAGAHVDPNDNGASDQAPSPGHGRYRAEDYLGAHQVEVTHLTLSAGDACPECRQGTLYENAPGVLVRFVGQAPLQVTVYRLQKLRCQLCGKVFTASAPAGVGEEKYDHTVASTIGLLKYGSGLPFNRIERLQGNCEIPLAASTQWGIVSAAAALVVSAYEELIRQAAQGDVVHNDDTTVKILELMGKRAEQAPPGDDPHDPGRTGLFTSGVIATRAGIRIALFFSGRQHAGENLMDVLKHRAADLDTPIHMCDGLARNLPKELDTILANCLAHGRRNFVDLYDRFPAECRYVIEAFQIIYHNDKAAREQSLAANQRLSYHQVHSRPAVDSLQAWLERQFNERLVEPNSALGQAIHYLLKRWDSLTLFLRKAGAPLDNNLCERALKKAILHRKNSLFYKTRNGAGVGDIYMSLIYTCELNGASAFDYLNRLQLARVEVSEHPDRWMPWNYRDNLAPKAA